MRFKFFPAFIAAFFLISGFLVISPALSRPLAAETSVVPANALYVYLTRDGGIFILKDTVQSGRWLSLEDLEVELAALKARGGTVLYSRELPEQDPTPDAEEILDVILSYRLPIRLVAESPAEYGA